MSFSNIIGTFLYLRGLFVMIMQIFDLSIERPKPSWASKTQTIMHRIATLFSLILFSGLLSGQGCDSLLYSEPFTASQPVGWTGDFNMLGGGLVEGWVTHTGTTTTANTGPNAASEGSHYLYLESSGPAPINSAYAVQTPNVELPTGGVSTLSFDYLMYGSDIGRFYVTIEGAGITTDTLLDLSGQQHPSGDLWESTSIDLSSYTGQTVSIKFTGMKMITGLGDIGIDEVQLCYTSSEVVPTVGQWSIIILGLIMMIVLVSSRVTLTTTFSK